MTADAPVPKARSEGRGPTIWLAGTPDDLAPWMPLGIAGIVTNTVVLNQYAKSYGSVIALIKEYLDITDKPVVVEIDGHSVEETARGWEGFYRPVESDYPENPLLCKRAEGIQRSQAGWD